MGMGGVAGILNFERVILEELRMRSDHQFSENQSTFPTCLNHAYLKLFMKEGGQAG